MGKKAINSLILRLGIKKKWLSKYFEKKERELNLFVYHDLQIQQFIKIFLLKFGLKLVYLEAYYKKLNLTLFLVYTIDLQKFKTLIKKKNVKFKNFVLNKKLFNFYKKVNLHSHFKTNAKIKLKYLKLRKFSNLISNYLFKKLKTIKLHKNSQNFRLFFKQKLCEKRAVLLNYLNLLKKYNKNFINKFLNKIFISLNNFLNQKITITLIIKQLNKNCLLTKQQKLNLSFNILNLRKFEKITDFKLNINLLYSMIHDKSKTINLISDFISTQLSKIRNPKFFNFFFKFALNAIKYLLLFSKKFKGIIIQIKGNLSKNPRALKKTVFLGIPISKNLLNNNLNYHEATSFSKKGTIGVKVWLQ